MSKNTLRNVKASVEVHEVKDELSEAELNAVSGGKQKPDGSAAGNVAAKWSVAQGAVA
jgi:bacteriocin-like protein